MRRLFAVILITILLVSASGYWLYQRPLPQVSAEVIIPQSTASAAAELPWPAFGQAALGAVDHGVLQTHNAKSAVPIASIAKAITALAILKEKPLQPGQPGPAITITEIDVRSFNEYLAKNGSVVPVEVGDQISQYQALQAMMLPSANNVADTAARWAFGSIDEYVTYANRFVQSLGMTQTTVDDASGFSPKTVSTAKDLVLLAQAALQNPILADVVSQSEANFPGVGTLHNVNWLLKTDGIIGIKTGNTDEAGGCFLFGAKRTVANRPITVIGAVLGAPTRNDAMAASQRLVKAGDKGFELVTAVRAHQVVGHYTLPWGGSVDAVAAEDLQILHWKGSPVVTDTDLNSLQTPQSSNEVVGSVKIIGGENKAVPVVLKQPISEPSLMWRVIR